MKYDISEYINSKDPLYIKGCQAIKRRDIQKLEEVINHSDFDSASFEARALLFCAAENANIDAFHKLGDAKVLLFNPLKIIKQRKHILFNDYDGPDVYLIQDTTPLHTLVQKINLRAYENLKLEEHFSKQDIERTLNTYSLKDKGTPLDVAWENYVESAAFLVNQAEKNNEEIALIPTDFFYFCAKATNYMPDMTAPTMVEAPLLYQKAIQKNDILTLTVIATLTTYTLNHIGYKFNKVEYEALYPLTEEGVAQEMKKGFDEPFIKTSFRHARNLFNKLFDRQRS